MPNMDVLKALDELKDAGVEERSARAMIRLVSEAVEMQAVTKPDLERECTAIRASLAQSTAELRGEIDGLRNELGDLRNELGDLRNDVGGLRGEFVKFRDKVEKNIAELHGDMTAFRIEMLIELAATRDSLNCP